MKRLLALLLILVACTPAWAAKKPPYTYFRVGNTADATTGTTAGTVLMGGSTDVDAAFQRMCSLAGNGDFLVIRATGTDAYNPYIQALCPAANSVATLIIPSTTGANDPNVAAIMQNAEAIWIAGGDQSNYINFWTGTPVQTILNAKIAAGVPVGGTSAGMNVLTEFVYSALAPQGATSSQSLADPFNRYLTFARDFANVSSLVGVIGDPHFVARDRMGRDLAFLCRIAANGWSTAPRGVAVDEQTALLIDASGHATVVGNSTAYFLQAPGLPEVCAENAADLRQHRRAAHRRRRHVRLQHLAGDRCDELLRVGGCGRVEFHAARRFGVLTEHHCPRTRRPGLGQRSSGLRQRKMVGQGPPRALRCAQFFGAEPTMRIALRRRSSARTPSWFCSRGFLTVGKQALETRILAQRILTKIQLQIDRIEPVRRLQQMWEHRNRRIVVAEPALDLRERDLGCRFIIASSRYDSTASRAAFNAACSSPMPHRPRPTSIAGPCYRRVRPKPALA